MANGIEEIGVGDDKPQLSMDESRSTLIVGLGETGLSCARYLRARGIAFSVVDSRSAPPGVTELKRECPEAPVHLGDFDARHFAAADCLIVSPGVSLEEPPLRAAVQAGAVVLGDIEMFAGVATSPVVAITGSNGKSTVTVLLGQMAERAGMRTKVGGNLGPPALTLLEGEEPDLYVLELSSFQLETTHSLRPAAAVVLNITADHMDRYADFDTYFNAKQSVYANADQAIVNRDDPNVARMVVEERAPVRYGLCEPGREEFGLRHRDGEAWLAHGSEHLMPAAQIALPGMHNVSNALAALALGRSIGLEWPPMLETLRTFAGLPHRCQLVCEHRGVRWYDDSKATNVGATIAALGGIRVEGRLVLIAGGDGKGADFRPLGRALDERIAAVVLLGRDAGRIERELDAGVNRVRVTSMAEAVRAADGHAVAGDAVLLSPACASFDMYASYQERGEHYARLVRRLTA